jgi:hypothetical protein
MIAAADENIRKYRVSRPGMHSELSHIKASTKADDLLSNDHSHMSPTLGQMPDV